MIDENLSQKAKEIIEKIIYLTLATVNANNKPWSSPVFSAFDDQYNFYWRSGKDAVHSQNIRLNGNVFISIYDSTAPWGTGIGVFIQAKATELNKESEINYALSRLDNRCSKKIGNVTTFMNDSPKRIYKAVPEKIWINVDEEINGQFVDKRVEVQLAK